LSGNLFNSIGDFLKQWMAMLVVPLCLKQHFAGIFSFEFNIEPFFDSTCSDKCFNFDLSRANVIIVLSVFIPNL